VCKPSSAFPIQSIDVEAWTIAVTTERFESLSRQIEQLRREDRLRPGNGFESATGYQAAEIERKKINLRRMADQLDEQKPQATFKYYNVPADNISIRMR
jgi:hypothetical protein